MKEQLDVLPARIETSYVRITQLNGAIQAAGFTLAQALVQTNVAVVVAPSITVFGGNPR